MWRNQLFIKILKAITKLALGLTSSPEPPPSLVSQALDPGLVPLGVQPGSGGCEQCQGSRLYEKAVGRTAQINWPVAFLFWAKTTVISPSPGAPRVSVPPCLTPPCFPRWWLTLPPTLLASSQAHPTPYLQWVSLSPSNGFSWCSQTPRFFQIKRRGDFVVFCNGTSALQVGVFQLFHWRVPLCEPVLAKYMFIIRASVKWALILCQTPPAPYIHRPSSSQPFGTGYY